VDEGAIRAAAARPGEGERNGEGIKKSAALRDRKNAAENKLMKTSYRWSSQQSTLADAKARLTIHGLWRHFGFNGEPTASCHSPFRDDRKKSFSVFDGGTRWKDFSTGESGNAVDFLQRASGLSQKEACRKFIELAGGTFRSAPRPAWPRRSEAKPKPIFPDFSIGTAEDFKQLARLRNVSREGMGRRTRFVTVCHTEGLPGLDSDRQDAAERASAPDGRA
jgi:CHC2 zinc finger